MHTWPCCHFLLRIDPYIDTNIDPCSTFRLQKHSNTSSKPTNVTSAMLNPQPGEIKMRRQFACSHSILRQIPCKHTNAIRLTSSHQASAACNAASNTRLNTVNENAFPKSPPIWLGETFCHTREGLNPCKRIISVSVKRLPCCIDQKRNDDALECVMQGQ